MSTPLDSHCARCMTPAPPVESDSDLYWEAYTVDGAVVVCPDCITPEEQQQMDDQTDDARNAAEDMWTGLRSDLELEAAAADHAAWAERKPWEQLVAWATTSAAGNWDTQGIAVELEDRETDDYTGVLVAEAPGDCVTPDGHVDHQALDTLLAAIGYRRVTGWDDAADGQLVADVEPV